jgi:hypothetical protein
MKKQKKLNFESFSLATRDFCQTWPIFEFRVVGQPETTEERLKVAFPKFSCKSMDPAIRHKETAHEKLI